MLRPLLLGAALAAAASGPAGAQDADALRARHVALREALSSTPFGRPLHVESSAKPGEQRGDVFALVDRAFGTVAPALRDAERWCDVLILPPNVKRCEASPGERGLDLYVATRPEDPPKDAFFVGFDYRLVAATADYLRVELSSEEGPFGTSDYRISLEAAPLGDRRTLLHLSYSYSQGFAARLATQAYLATSGRGKVGFSVVGQDGDGRPEYVDGVRGVVERNAMRYYLAVEAYLDSLDAPAGERFERRLNDWFSAIERYPRQLDESIERAEYVRMKRVEAGEGSSAGAGRPAQRWGTIQ